MVLSQNFPNPFNQMTTIKFNLEKPGSINLKIYDLLSREVETLINSKYQTGEYKIIWDARDLPSGMYLYSIKAEDLTETKKIILLR